MSTYLLSNEKDRINKLINLLALKLNHSKNDLIFIKEELEDIIKNNRNSSIEDILNYYFTLFQSKIENLLKEKITPGIQFGIRNKHFFVTGYGGNYNGRKHSKEIDNTTFFSFDSISKIIISIIMLEFIEEKKLTLDTIIHEYNSDFMMNASIEEILKFTAMIRTEKRIDGLSKEETIDILKRCKQNIEEKTLYKNFYEYNDIGYMILRLSTDDFLTKLDTLLERIDSKNLIYRWNEYSSLITGGKLSEEYITPDLKGRDILFPGHTGLYGNIEGLLNLFDTIFNTNNILTKEELNLLLKQPYFDPVVYAKDGNQLVGKNQSLQYMAKIAGIYRMPNNINDMNYNKMASCDMSNLTTKEAKASTGTCGSWVITDNLHYQNHFDTYTAGLLTNPYSFIEPGNYPNLKNNIPNTNLVFNQKGIILGYQSNLNQYKELITNYGLLLELITEYIKEDDTQILENNQYKLIKKIS